jgi:hypothetical protein
MKTGLLLVATAAFLAGASFADVIVNEIMFNPSTTLGDDNYFEWIEIHNDGASAVDISGWIVTDLDPGSGCIAPAGTSIAAGGYLVFARSSSDFTAHYGAGIPLVAWTGSWGSGLNNTSDDVAIILADSTVIDQVPYEDTTEWGSDYGDDNSFADCDGDGASLERIDPAGPASDPANWDSSIDEASGFPDANWEGHDESHGTPGAVNSVSTIGLDASTWAEIKAVF